MSKLRIIYMGTPEFAVPSLDLLVEQGWNVVAVITAPDKPQGRGKKLAGSPVKEAALRHDIPVLQPTNLKSPEFIEELRSYQADVQVVVPLGCCRKWYGTCPIRVHLTYMLPCCRIT